AEVEPFLREILHKARTDMEWKFPQREPRERISQWFDHEEKLLAELLSDCAGGSLVDMYHDWLSRYLSEWVTLDATSSLFACGADPMRTALLEVFTANYDLAAGLYNQAVAETTVGLRPLNTSDGELPFFAVLDYRGHRVRVPALLRGESIHLGEKTFKLAPGRLLPVEELRSAGFCCLAGKAVVLAIQARLGPGGNPLALPYRGSLYMPAADKLAEKLTARRLLPGRVHPVVRIRLGLLDHMKSLDTIIRLPEHLRACFGEEEIPARQLGKNYRAMAAEAAKRLQKFADASFRRKWQEETFEKLAAEIKTLDARRRKLAETDPKGKEIRELSWWIKSIRNEMLEGLLRQIARDWQVSHIDYWDSRGAIWLSCIALGGEEFYDKVIDAAEIYTESFPEGRRGE
ncbi:MAG: hypothetical protein KAU28_11215, partial [Phycisphaerae bacterium]|nr:hypothetical protein [Phycisphaerae bacterium]